MESKIHLLFLSVLSVSVIVLTVSLSVSPSVSSVSAKNLSVSPSVSVSVSATVPAYFWLELSGWTSSWAQVELSMQQTIKRITRADQEGRFIFRLALPQTLGPFCLIAIDIAGTASYPLCIPPPPADTNILVKEVVMPPTLTLAKGNMSKGETVAAQGFTTPNSIVVPYLFDQSKRAREQESENFYSSTLLLFHSVYAAEGPKPPIKSNQNGFYQFNLPTGETGKNRVFVGSIFLESPTPKSTTLVFNVSSLWQNFIAKLLFFLTFLLSLLLRFLTSLTGVIAIETITICILIYLLFFHRQGKNPKGGKILNPNIEIRILSTG